MKYMLTATKFQVALIVYIPKDHIYTPVIRTQRDDMVMCVHTKPLVLTMGT